MDKGEAIGVLYVEVSAVDNITKELKKIERLAEKGAENIEDQFNSLRLTFKTDLMKKNMKQIGQDYDKLKKEFDKAIKLDANYEDLEKLKIKLDESENALKRFSKQADKAGKEVDESFIGKLKTKFGAFGAMMATAFAGTAIFSFLKGSVEAFFESEKAAASLEQQLGYTSDALNAYAAAVQKTTVYEDDLVIGAMTRIAAFTKDEEQIKALTAASLDLAAAKGMDLVSAADMVAKSFGSEMNALARSSIVLDGAAGSTERLHQLTEGISRLYAGQASAQAQTYGGKIANLKNRFGDLRENIGKAMMPALEGLGKMFGKMNDQANTTGGSVGALEGVFNAFATVLGSVWLVAYGVGGTIGVLGATLAKLVTLDFEGVSDAFNQGFSDLWNEIKNISYSIGDMWKPKPIPVKVKPIVEEWEGLGGGTNSVAEEEKKAREEREQADANRYNELKWLDTGYGEFLKKQWDKQKAEYLKQNMDKIKIDMWYSEQRKKAEKDFQEWWKENGEEISRQPTYKQTKYGMEYQYEGVSNLPLPERTPFDLTKSPVNLINSRLIPDTPKPDFSTIDVVQDLIDKSVEAQIGFESFGAAVADTFGLIKINVDENASAITQIWANMINSMIDKLGVLLSQWLIFNTIASFLPGAGFGSIGFKTLLGIPEAATGGTFLGTNNGVMKMAMGGDFIVPQGFANDSYPMLVQSGERVKVTPSGKVGDEAQLLAKLIDAVEANTLDRRMLGSRPIIVQPKISIGQRDLTKEVQKTNKTIAREGWKQE